MATCQQPRSNRMPGNTCIGPDWMLISDYTRRYQECVCQAHPPKEPLQAHDVPEQPWEQIVMDHFDINGKLYVLVCAYFNKFPFVFHTKTTSFVNLRDHLQQLFMIEGTPDEIISGNGPPFNGKEFSTFLTGLPHHSTIHRVMVSFRDRSRL